MLMFLLTAVMAADAPQVSWGKPGVSIDAYRADANLCASRAWNADISDTEAVRVFRQGTQQIDAIAQTAGSSTPSIQIDTGTGGAAIDPFELNRQVQIGRIVEGARPRERMQEVREVQQGALARCLKERGYVRFALTERQRKALTKLKRGSDVRHAYLHALASDSAVLAAQATAAVSPPSP